MLWQVRSGCAGLQFWFLFWLQLTCLWRRGRITAALPVVRWGGQRYLLATNHRWRRLLLVCERGKMSATATARGRRGRGGEPVNSRDRRIAARPQPRLWQDGQERRGHFPAWSWSWISSSAEFNHIAVEVVRIATHGLHHAYKLVLVKQVLHDSWHRYFTKIFHYLTMVGS